MSEVRSSYLVVHSMMVAKNTKSSKSKAVSPKSEMYSLLHFGYTLTAKRSSC